MISAHAATAHVVLSWTGFIVRTAMPELYPADLRTEWRRTGLDFRNRKPCDCPELRCRLAGLRDTRVAGDREEDECILRREAVLVHEQPRRLLRDELQRVGELVGGRVREPAIRKL